MKTKKHFIISLIVHLAIISLILFFPSCPEKKKKIEVIESLQIVTPVEPEIKPEPVKPKPEPEKPKPKPEKPKPKKSKPKPVKKKKIVKKYTPDDLKNRLQEKLKEKPKVTKKQSSTPKTTTNIRTTIKENWYLAQIKSKIENSWQQPSRILMSGLETVKLTIGFTLQKNGSAKKVRILKSSGIAVVDISAVNAVKSASPFPPIPEKSGNKPIDFAIDFTLKE
ncbi:MAG: TonB C-terminal domain-containing protein [Candidatus Aureabacteria bacterium]|nr:TonB C-terminal domain-containing protein [Candidatus Auribacterota bacterium]